MVSISDDTDSIFYAYDIKYLIDSIFNAIVLLFVERSSISAFNFLRDEGKKMLGCKNFFLNLEL